MYIHFSSGVANIQKPTTNEEISKFVAKANPELVIGYEVENVNKNLEYVLTKLALVMCLIREKSKKTQKEFSTVLNVSEGTYKSIERAEHNISFDTLDFIFDQFPKEEILHRAF